MAEERVQRRLAAILAADVVGYARLMEADETGTLARLKELRRELFEPATKEHGGRIFKTTGDGALVEFASAVDAATSAVDVQHMLARRNANTAEDQRICLRIGISLGDVIVEGRDLFGNGVNVAARLERLAKPGGLCVSEDVYRQVRRSLDFTFDDLGPVAVKNMDEPVHVYGVDLGFDGRRLDSAPQPTSKVQQRIRFCTSFDGVRIAYSTVGDGPPLVKAGGWMSHIELDWDSPVRGPMIRELAGYNRLVRYDARGNGLSDRDVENISFDAFVRDLEAVVDAAGLDRFALIGISQGAPVSVGFALRHPERVTRMILLGGHTVGWRGIGTPEQIHQREAMTSLIRSGWGQVNPAFRQIFTTRHIPGASDELVRWYSEMQRVTVSPEEAARIYDALGDFPDLRPSLSRIAAPTLVLHSRGDATIPFDEGRIFAAGIPNARFVPLESRNHVLLADEPAWARFVSEVRDFLAEDEAA